MRRQFIMTSWDRNAAAITCPLLLCPVLSSLTKNEYRQVSNISRTLVGNKIVDNSDVVGASPVGAAPTTSSLST